MPQRKRARARTWEAASRANSSASSSSSSSSSHTSTSPLSNSACSAPPELRRNSSDTWALPAIPGAPADTPSTRVWVPNVKGFALKLIPRFSIVRGALRPTGPAPVCTPTPTSTAVPSCASGNEAGVHSYEACGSSCRDAQESPTHWKRNSGIP